MKRIFSGLFLFLISTVSFSATSSSNFCITHIQDYFDGAEYHLDNCKITDADLPDLINIVNQQNIQAYVSLAHNSITSAGAGTLAQIKKQMWVLDLSYNILSDDGFMPLVTQQSVQNLMLSHNQINDTDVIEMAKSGNPYFIYLGDNPITPKGVSALAQSSFSMMDLSDLTITEDNINQLASDPRIVTLILTNDKINDAEVSKLATTGIFDLELDSNSLGIASFKALSTDVNLQVLSVSNDHVGDQGLAFLVGIPPFGFLYVNNDNITGVGAQSIADSKLFYVAIDNNSIGDDGLLAIMKDKQLSGLSANNNSITDKAILAIATTNSALFSLSLDNNSITDIGVNALAGARINEISLSKDKITDTGAISLSKNPAIRWLDVSYNNIGKLGLIALLNDSSLNYLNIDGNISLPAINVKVSGSNKHINHDLRLFHDLHLKALKS